MGIPGGDPKEYDYRKLPRVADEDRRTKILGITTTPEEFNAMHQLAREKGMTVSDYVIRRCLGASTRPKVRSRRSDT